ncbi:MAG TPA: Gfo/Idh/MocA family oxidoreductase [Acidimicrobiales bacterium]|nr:Gfo/Idh/MocA family oxidoreductase [Acidimicrobiales bacterium]
MRIVLAGEGAIAGKHIAALGRIDDAEVVGLVGGNPDDTAAFAAEHGIGWHTLDLDEALARPEVDAVILTTPTPLHAAQAIAALEAGKHVLVEIPMADNLADGEAVVAAQQRTGLTAMAGHTRRFNPSHQWVHQRIAAGQLHLQHLVVETFFFRRTNTNALGRPRSWTDHLLWHHACHTVDLFQHQTGEAAAAVWAAQGPVHPELGIALDMGIGLQTPSGALCTLALSFNNEGPFGTTFRYIGDTGTYVARYDDLVDGYDEPIDLSSVIAAAGAGASGAVGSGDGIERQDREFVAAVAEGREPEASVASCLPALQTLDRIERALVR